jgi:8-oxo-dGTP pyrophosphatase MutT (NUDIX family)
VEVRTRWAARAVLLDPRDRLLLLCSFDPQDAVRGRWWTTVGGGVEPGEPPEAALRREIQEEVGIRDVSLGPLLWRRRSRFRFRGVVYDQDNHYYLARTPVTEVDLTGAQAIELETTVEHYWWRLDELHASDQVIYPNGLAGLLASLLTDGPPATPLVLPTDAEGGLAP